LQVTVANVKMPTPFGFGGWIHQHMIGRQPTIYFLHYRGTGPADKLATGFKAALEQLGNATAAGANK
jgi:hypothetical protein